MDEITNLSRELAIKASVARRIKAATIGETASRALSNGAAGAVLGGAVGGVGGAILKRDKTKTRLENARDGAVHGAVYGGGAFAAQSVGGDIGKGIAERMRKKAVSGALLGAGAGALVGGALGGGSALRRKDKRKNLLGNTLHGALLGAGAGAGVGGVASMVGKLPSSSGGPSLPKSIDASSVAKELDKVKPSLLDQAVGTVTAPAKALGSYAANHPFLAAIGGADALSHGVGTAANSARNIARVPTMNPDDFLKGLDRLSAEGGKENRWGKLKSTLGASRDKVQDLLLKARQSNTQTQGLAPNTAAPAAANPAMDLDAMVAKAEGGPFATGPGAGDALKKTKVKTDAAAKATSIAGNLTDTKNIPGHDLSAQDVFDIGRKGQDAVQPGGYRDIVDLLGIGRSARNASGSLDSHNARLTGGSPADFGRSVSAAGDAVSNLPQGANEGNMLQRALGWLRSPQSRRLQSDYLTGAPRASTLARGILPRLALYGGVPLVQSAMGNWFKQLAEQRRLDQLLGQNKG